MSLKLTLYWTRLFGMLYWLNIAAASLEPLCHMLIVLAEWVSANEGPYLESTWCGSSTSTVALSC